MSFIVDLQKLFKDYKTLLDKYTPSRAVVVSDEEKYYQSILQGVVVPEDYTIYQELPKITIN